MATDGKKAKAVKGPARAYSLRMVNHVCVSRIIQLGERKGMPLPLVPVAMSLSGRLAENSFPSVMVRLIEPNRERPPPHFHTPHQIHDPMPGVCCIIFASGVFIVCGAREEERAHMAMHDCIAVLSEDLQIPMRLDRFHVRNAVGSMATGFMLNLNLFYDDHAADCTYANENYPGLQWYIYGIKRRRPCMMLHTSGAVVGVGLEGREDAERVMALVDFKKYELGNEYRQLDPSRMREKKKRVPSNVETPEGSLPNGGSSSSSSKSAKKHKGVYKKGIKPATAKH